MYIVSLLCLIYCMILWIHTQHIKYKWIIFSLLAFLSNYLFPIKVVVVSIGIFMMIVSLTIYFLGNKKIKDPIPYMIIFGYQLENNQILPILKYRLDAAITYLYDHPDMKVIVSGGITRSNTVSESSKMVEYLISHGIHKDRIIEETKSTITLENLVYSKEYIGSFDTPILLVTNQFHMFRCILLARFVGYSKLYKLPVQSGIEVIDKLVEEIYFFMVMLKKRNEY